MKNKQISLGVETLTFHHPLKSLLYLMVSVFNRVLQQLIGLCTHISTCVCFLQDVTL